MTADVRHDYPYTGHYCEENIWMLANHPDFAEALSHTHVAIISNPLRKCPIWGQRASLLYGDPVVWDYHVILIQALPGATAQVWDLDALIGAPAPLSAWWESAFPYMQHMLPQFLPMFRLFSAQDYITLLSSDRRHMRDGHGGWRAPPPPWPMIHDGASHNLEALIDFTHQEPGELLDQQAFRERFSS